MDLSNEGEASEFFDICNLIWILNSKIAIWDIRIILVVQTNSEFINNFYYELIGVWSS